MIFAQIFNNSVSNIIELEDEALIPIFTEGFERLVRVDNRLSMPGMAWHYDHITDTFYPPVTRHVLESFIATTLSETNPVIDSYYVKNTGSVTTSSATPSILSGITVTPSTGSYIVQFSGSATTVGASAAGAFGIYVNGVAIADTIRPISCNLQLLGGLVSVSLNNISVGTATGTQVRLNGTDVVDVRFRSTNGGTIGFNERSMILINVGISEG